MNVANPPSHEHWTPPVIAHARRYERGVQLGQHAHRQAQLLFAATGMMHVTTPRGRWLVPPQRAVWLPPRFEHAVDVLADIEMRTLYISSDWLADCASRPRLDQDFVAVVSPLLRELILATFEPARPAAHIDWLTHLALHEVVEAPDTVTFMPMPTDPRARRVAMIVLSDVTSERDVADLASEAGLSARTLARLFPVETRLTFKQWRQRARIMVAVETFASGPSSIKQTAAKLGFSSMAAFAHAFSQVMGITPSEFKAQTTSMT